MEAGPEEELPELTGPGNAKGETPTYSPSGVALGEGVRGFKMELSSPSSTVKVTELKSGATAEDGGVRWAPSCGDPELGVQKKARIKISNNNNVNIKLVGLTIRDLQLIGLTIRGLCWSVLL
jgi:hypothetical protein